MLEINNISKIYIKGKHTFNALNNVSLNIESGDFIAVVGPSGSGKSTLLHTVGGLIRPDSGQVFFRGKSVYKMNSQEADQYRRKNVGFVFQQFHLIPYLTVYENIKLTEFDSKNGNDSIETILEKCALLPLKNKYPSELSVGEKQRTAFVRAIVSKPEILLADEPTGNLDPENSQTLMLLVKEFHENGGTVLLVSHETGTSNYANRIVTLRSGKLL